MRLFDDTQRVYHGPRKHSEPSFDYLNRSARDEASGIRELLECWARRLPDAGKKDVVERLRSRDDAQHCGALLELYCGELLRAHGLSLEPHPTTETEKRKHPDFLVRMGTEPICYVECTLAGDPMLDTARQARLNEVLDGLDQLDPKRFSIIVEVQAVGGSSPSTRKLRSEIESWLCELEGTRLSGAGTDVEPCSVHTWRMNGWALTFRAFARSQKQSGVRRRGMAGHTYGMRYGDSSGRLRKALEQKAKHYGDLTLPYIVAVNFLDDVIEDYDVMEALFGDARYRISTTTEEATEERAPNGLWTSTRGYRYRRVSGVLLINNLTPWTLRKATAVLWHHPAPRHALEPSIWRIPQMLPDKSQDTMVQRDGARPSLLLGLERTRDS